MHKAKIDVISLDKIEFWHKILNKCDGFDFYHLPEYHQLAEKNNEGQAVLVVYQENSRIAAWPFLFRAVNTIPGLADVSAEFRDATSVYGYPGPVCSANARKNSQFLKRFGKALQNIATDLNLVSMFSRLNPVLNNISLTSGLGESRGLGQTVSIDLSKDPKTQWLDYKKNIRYDIKRARREGVQAYRDPDWVNFDEFFNLYTLTMTRVNASPYYFFDRSYFLDLREALGNRLQLFAAEIEGVVRAASLFVRTGEIIQYHLAGSDAQDSKLDPAKVVIDEARLWGNDVGAHYLHLGGGVGSSEDSLFWQKSRFSPLRHNFFVWQYTVMPEVYENLVRLRNIWLEEHGRKVVSTDFFPLYRAE